MFLLFYLICLAISKIKTVGTSLLFYEKILQQKVLEISVRNNHIFYILLMPESMLQFYKFIHDVLGWNKR